MKKGVYTALLMFFAAALTSYAQDVKTIRGTVTDGTQPMKDVRIAVQGREGESTYTDAEGKYEIQAMTGDLLKYSYTGMRDYLVRVEEVTRHLNLLMIPDVEELDEVTVTKTRLKSQKDLAIEYAENPNIIRTAWGYLNADTEPGNIRLLAEKDINPISICILNVLRNRFAGIRVRGDCFQGGDIFIRTQGSLALKVAIYDVDGQIFTETPIWLDVNQIKRLAVLSSMAYSSRYGSIGGGGVVVINTFSGNPRQDQIADKARLRNNYVGKPALGAEAVASSEPTYMQAFREADTFEDAQTVYARYESQYRTSPYFYLDAYRHFYQDLGETEFADQILRTNNRVFEGNAPMLKALAYLYQEQGRYVEALETLKEVFILRPNYSQSYQDLAGAYRDVGAYKNSAGMYARYKYLVAENFFLPSTDFSRIIQHESDNLLQLHAGKIGINSGKIITDLNVQNITRVVVEWNETEAEFELQFVNPEGQYHKWKHTFAENEGRIIDEKMTGYTMEEFILDNNLPGLWEINVRYDGNKSLTPTYMKITTYYNYGERDQKKQVRTFKLSLKNNWQQLLSINNPGVSRVR